MPVGNNRQAVVKKKKHHDHIRARPGRDGNNKHPSTKKYELIDQNEVMFEEYHTSDADYLIVAFGSIARIALKAIEDLRKQGIKIGLLRPITLWPFPKNRILELSNQVKGILCVEINAGQ